MYKAKKSLRSHNKYWLKSRCESRISGKGAMTKFAKGNHLKINVKGNNSKKKNIF